MFLTCSNSLSGVGRSTSGNDSISSTSGNKLFSRSFIRNPVTNYQYIFNQDNTRSCTSCRGKCLNFGKINIVQILSPNRLYLFKACFLPTGPLVKTIESVPAPSSQYSIMCFIGSSPKWVMQILWNRRKKLVMLLLPVMVTHFIREIGFFPRELRDGVGDGYFFLLFRCKFNIFESQESK